jgi:protein-disulfide isomerase
LIAIRRRLAAALAVAALAALAPRLMGVAVAQSATADLVTKPMSLPDMALGPAKAPVIIVEYASMSCPHCAAFEQNVLPMLRSKYIDTGKVRFVFREFPLDMNAAAASMLARCIGGDDVEKFYATVDLMFKQQDQLMAQTLATLQLIAKQAAGMDDKAVEACETNQAMLDRIAADQKFAFETLKVQATPTFFINGELIKGAMSFEELDAKLKSLLKR